MVAEDDPEHEFALLMAEVIGADPGARAEYSEILRRANREETRRFERTLSEASTRER